MPHLSSRLSRCLGVLLAWGASLSAGASEPSASDLFEAYLRPSTPPADGFEPMPVPSRLRAGSELRALAHGRVEAVGEDGRSLTVEHLYYENHELLRVRSEYAGLDGVAVRAGELITRGQRLGRVRSRKELRVTLHTEQPLSATEARHFTQARASLPVPAREPVLLLISQTHHEMRLYAQGREERRVEVGFGQAEGRKEVRGDNRTPRI